MTGARRSDDQTLLLQQIDAARTNVTKAKRDLKKARETVKRRAEDLARLEMRARGFDIDVRLISLPPDTTTP